MSEPIIKVQDVSKSFRLPHERHTGLKQAVINFRPGRKFEKQQVLEDISFEINKGEFFGIVGRNGSGKSTLLKLLAHIYTPDSGGVVVNGTLTPFIELGVGFNPELTGRENVYLNGALLGLNRNKVDKIYDEIVQFAELERFMDQKLKNYSSGMQVRLAFSIAIRAESDILLVDEVLAVGDAAFQAKCFDYFYKLKQQGKTVVFISHDRSSLQRFCDKGILIDKGRIISRGNIDKVLDSYNEVVLSRMSVDGDKETNTTGSLKEHNVVDILNVHASSIDGKKVKRFNYGHPIFVNFSFEVKENINNPIIGITIWRKNLESPIFATNTFMQGKKKLGLFEKGTIARCQLELPAILNDGEYSIEPAVANSTATVFYGRTLESSSFVISGSPNSMPAIYSKDELRVERQ